VVRYTLGEQQARNIFASRYQLHLPTEEDLQQELRRELRQLIAPGSTLAQRAEPKVRTAKKKKKGEA
jgi:hypothetical protein